MCLKLVTLAALIALSAGCSVKTFAINKVGDARRQAIRSMRPTIHRARRRCAAVRPEADRKPAGAIPDHPGLLLTACRGFVLYSYASRWLPGGAGERRRRGSARALRARRNGSISDRSGRIPRARALVSWH
jgi:hypothetical protein